MKKTVLVGVGALGSAAAPLLRNLEISLTLVDFDQVETKNTLSQMHPKSSIRRNKAVAMQQFLNGMFGIKGTAIPHKLSIQNATELLEGVDLILDCTDNFEARSLMKSHAWYFRIPLLHGAVSGDGTFGQVVWTEDFEIDKETPGVPTCEDGEHLPILNLIGSQIAVTAQRFLKTGDKRGYHVTPNGITRVH